MINKERLIAITDGIIAVAATVMVLRLDIPEMVSLAAIRERVPILVAYIISYMQIFLAWHEHHDSFIHAEKINHRIFLMNTLWLFLITMLPFVTGVLGQSPAHRPTILLYLAVLVLQVCVQTLECRMIEKLNGNRMQGIDVFMKHGMKQISRIVILKTVHRERMEQNSAPCDLEQTKNEMAAIAKPDPCMPQMPDTVSCAKTVSGVLLL